MSSSSILKSESRCPLREQFLQKRISRENLDRFIPNRSSTDFDFADFMLTEGREDPEPNVNPRTGRWCRLSGWRLCLLWLNLRELVWILTLVAKEVDGGCALVSAFIILSVSCFRF
ncbi:hypothetical protein Pyn_11874 [Prunus yedoensis var. nudiflora]|uniref:Uncharacterized protein n=1 Tax=Prunus yedoensis var. nudiflora TaxID=2094558 RepID=A0A314XRX9_PRUYE|nr:hypothetical protein Pyn_11874 [Prunus yedoensis var. nudiflora]